MKQKLSVRCECGSWGTLIFKGKIDEEGKKIVQFKCKCDSPKIDFDNPYLGYYA